MPISYSITATPRTVQLQHSRSPVTLTNNTGSANTLYYRLSQDGTTTSNFVGTNAAEISALAHGSLIVGGKRSLPAGLGTIDVACITAETATLEVDMGVAV